MKSQISMNIKQIVDFVFIDLEDRQQMRDRWLRDVFAAGLPSSTSESEQINNKGYQTLTGKDSIDEEEAVRLLSDNGISEDKAKVRLQVCLFLIN
jgi:hypothetical protein